VRRIKTATVLTHRRPDETGPAVMMLIEMAHEGGVTLRFDPEETAKHHLPDDPVVERNAPPGERVDICFALGGDGTILSALRRYAGTGVPVFGINFGEMGFLATVDREETWAGTLRALAGDFEVLSLPAIELAGAGTRALAINDISIHRHPGKRVADLAYSVGNDEIGRVRQNSAWPTIPPRASNSDGRQNSWADRAPGPMPSVPAASMSVSEAARQIRPVRSGRAGGRISRMRMSAPAAMRATGTT
jgi:ATP-NAD kinase N-terminal domain